MASDQNLSDRSDSVRSCFSRGQGLGDISSKYFEPTTWTNLIKHAEGQAQYQKFVKSMVGRIKLEESNADEIRAFVSLVASDVDHRLMSVALPYMPEIREEK